MLEPMEGEIWRGRRLGWLTLWVPPQSPLVHPRGHLPIFLYSLTSSCVSLRALSGCRSMLGPCKDRPECRQFQLQARPSTGEGQEWEDKCLSFLAHCETAQGVLHVLFRGAPVSMNPAAHSSKRLIHTLVSFTLCSVWPPTSDSAPWNHPKTPWTQSPLSLCFLGEPN